MRVRLTDIKFRVVFLETKLIPNFSKQEIKNMSCRFFFFQETTPNLSLLRLVVVAMGLFQSKNKKGRTEGNEEMDKKPVQGEGRRID